MLKYIKRNESPTPFERPDGMPEALHRLLMDRGVDSPEAAERFLHPDARSLHDPLLLSDMPRAVAVIRAAMARGDAICVYGDYDVDGVSASAIMKLWFDARGANARVYLPSRHAEGYGLNERAIREIAGWAKLMITVDCGVTSVELVALAKSLGMDVIVTDHHRPAEALPDCPVVNPLLGGYPYPALCGAGVAWKLVWALSGALPTDLVDLAALATVADVVPLTGENRAIVAMGLERINRAPRAGIAALIDAAGLSGKPVLAGTVAFQLAPRLNAGGRLDTAMRPLELLTTPDPGRAQALAGTLNSENAERRRIEQQILREAEAQLRGFDFIRHRAIILAGRDWNPGVIGLAASRLVEQYHYPVVMLSDQGETMTGSCRSIEGVDIHAALTGCRETLIQFGGHKQAAGLRLASERLGDFTEAMDRWLCENTPPEVYVPTASYDEEIALDAVDPLLISALEGLQPTGFGNPEAVFRARAEVVDAYAVGQDGSHLKLTLAQGGRLLGGIAFREGHRAGELRGGGAVDALFAPELNAFNGRISVQLKVKSLTNADANARIASNIDDELSLQCDFLTEIIYNKKIDSREVSALKTVDEAALAGWLSEAPQGTLMIAGDLSAAALAVKLGPCDLYIGRLPDDPRAFNAVCVCPRAGEIPASYRRVVLMGCPAEWLDQPGDACRLSTRPDWVRRLPDIDAMRDAYRALMSLMNRPAPIPSRHALAQALADLTHTDRLGATLSMLAIEDMALFDFDFDAAPVRFRRTPRKKVEPDASAAWRAIQRWRQGDL